MIKHVGSQFVLTASQQQQKQLTVRFWTKIIARFQFAATIHCSFEKLEVSPPHFDSVFHVLPIDDKLCLHLYEIFIVFHLIVWQAILQVGVDLVSTAVNAFFQRQGVGVLFRQFVAFWKEGGLKIQRIQSHNSQITRPTKRNIKLEAFRSQQNKVINQLVILIHQTIDHYK